MKTTKSQSETQDNTQLTFFQRDNLIWGCCLKPNEKLVLHCLNSFMGSDGKCWPKQQRLADMTSFSRKTVISILQGLESQGIIRTHQRTRASGGKSSKDYFVDWAALEFFQGVRPKGNRPMCSNVTSRREGVTQGQCEADSHLLTTHSFLKDHLLTNQGNIDSVSKENACTSGKFEDGLANNESEVGGNGSVSGQNQQDSGARETHETQNETIAPPKKKWNPSIPIGFDVSGYIKLPPLKDVDPKFKATYSAVWPKVYRETQFMVAEEWIDDITIDEDEDGEVLICDKDGDWTEREAFGQGGCLPLRKLRDIAAADPDSGFSVDEYNEFIIERFNYHWNRV